MKGVLARYDVTFTGRVQGVNFRWTTCRVAGQYSVAGWVRNQPGGSVRMVAEGEPQELDRFVGAVQEAMAGFIEATSIESAAAQGGLEGFSVRH